MVITHLLSRRGVKSYGDKSLLLEMTKPGGLATIKIEYDLDTARSFSAGTGHWLGQVPEAYFPRLIVDLEKEVAVGIIVFRKTSLPDWPYELGFSVVAKYRGQGYARAGLNHLFGQSEITGQNLLSFTSAANVASRKLLEAQGFELISKEESIKVCRYGRKSAQNT